MFSLVIMTEPYAFHDASEIEPYIYGVYTAFLAGKSPSIQSYTVYTYGSGQPYTCMHMICLTQGKQKAVCTCAYQCCAHTASFKNGIQKWPCISVYLCIAKGGAHACTGAGVSCTLLAGKRSK